MSYNPNATWTAAIDTKTQAPVYFLRLDELTGYDFSTAPVKTAAVPKHVLMKLPTGGGSAFDIISGRFSLSEIEVELADVDGEITELIATEVVGAALDSLINRKATLYHGMRDMAEADYAPIFTGRIVGLEQTPDGLAYRVKIADLTYLLDGQIMLDATDDTPATIAGNIVNLYWAILTGTFDTADPDFPLDLVSVADVDSSAPTGLGLATSLIDEAQLIAIRDVWHPNTRAEITFTDPVNAKQELERELFRTFQCWPAPSGSGQLGLRFVVPIASIPQALSVTETNHILGVTWRRRFDMHLNKYTYLGDYDPVNHEYPTTLYDTVDADDTANQTATGETVEYRVESRWLNSARGGVAAARDLAGRLRLLFRATPAELTLVLNARRLNIELGDVLAVTHRRVPDLATGTMGVTNKTLFVTSLHPDFATGTITVTAIDMNYLRYGGIAPDATPDYDSASADERLQYFFIGRDSDNAVGAALDPGYVFV